MTLKSTVAALGVASFLMSGCAAKEGGQSVYIRHAKVTLMEAAVIGERAVPESQAIKVELTHSNDAVFYEVEVLKKVLVDAETGRILPPDAGTPTAGRPSR
jgi:uncharacterized membrane protein YkoI